MMITHDLGVVAGVADRVLVMYAGNRVEEASVEDTFYEPQHPYTRGLLDSLPRLDRRSCGQRLYQIKGQPPPATALPSGCRFAPRCPHFRPDPCATARPEVRPIEPAHLVACHRVEEIGELTRA
jgi:oligopeptide/dipeptide ABC transporter ATP-binding protein